MTKLLYGITALILAVALGGFAYQTHRLGKAENRAVEATKMAQAYKGSLESLAGAVEAKDKSDKLARVFLENRAKKAEVMAAKTKKENHALQEALAASPDWTRQPIPAGVLSSINHN